MRTFWRGVGLEASLLTGSLLPSLSGQPRFLATPQILLMTSVQRPQLPQAHIWYEDSPQAPVTHLFRRGDPKRAADAVTPGLPAVLATEQPPPPTAPAHSTGRRRWLAEWMTRPDNPLTARVMVNRVWMHHFGKGLVSTPNDFGVMGSAAVPCRTARLAGHMVYGRGLAFEAAASADCAFERLPDLLRLLEADAGQGDQKLALFGRWRQRRLEAEAVRDSMLAVSGQLNPPTDGPSVFPPLAASRARRTIASRQRLGNSSPLQAARRSIYVFCKRSLAVPELELLDTPDTTSSLRAAAALDHGARRR